MCNNRLLLVGPSRALCRFARSPWPRRARARFLDPLEASSGRLAWQFETDQPPLRYLTIASRHWPALTFLLDYEIEREGIKGLARARRGELADCLIHYHP
jgi:hypothetical protein